MFGIPTTTLGYWTQENLLNMLVDAADGNIADQVRLNETSSFGARRARSAVAVRRGMRLTHSEKPYGGRGATIPPTIQSKLEAIGTPPTGQGRYRQFAQVWKALYTNHAETIESLDLGGYPYRVRIFDTILVILGEQKYGLRSHS